MPKIPKTNEAIDYWEEPPDREQLPVSGQLRLQMIKYFTNLQPKAGATLLDVGCGDGKLLVRAIEAGLKTTGLESRPALAVISQKTAPRAHVVVGNARELPFENDWFDMITVLDIREYFEQPAQGLVEIQRVLKKHGQALIFFNNSRYHAPEKGPGKNVRHQRIPAYPLSLWKKLLQRSGLKIGVLHPVILFRKVMPSNPTGFFTRLTESVFRILRWIIPKKWIPGYVCICYK